MSNAIDVNRGNFDEVVLLGSTGTAVLVDFWAPWCAPCRALAPVLDRIATEFAGRLTLAKVNTDEEPDLARAYGIRGIPNCKLFVDGRVVDEFTGVLPESAVREFITKSVPSVATSLVEEAKSRLIEDDATGALELLGQALAIDPDDEDAALTRMEALLVAERPSDALAVANELASPERDRVRPVRDALRLATLRARAQLALGGSEDLDALRATPRRRRTTRRHASTMRTRSRPAATTRARSTSCCRSSTPTARTTTKRRARRC